MCYQYIIQTNKENSHLVVFIYEFQSTTEKKKNFIKDTAKLLHKMWVLGIA